VRPDARRDREPLRDLPVVLGEDGWADPPAAALRKAGRLDRLVEEIEADRQVMVGEPLVPLGASLEEDVLRALELVEGVGAALILEELIDDVAAVQGEGEGSVLGEAEAGADREEDLVDAVRVV